MHEGDGRLEESVAKSEWLRRIRAVFKLILAFVNVDTIMLMIQSTLYELDEVHIKTIRRSPWCVPAFLMEECSFL